MRYDPLPPPVSPAPNEPKPALDGKRPWWRRRRVWLWLTPAVAATTAALAGVTVAASIHMPEVEKKLDDFVPRIVTHLYDQHGQPFRSYSRENRVLLHEGDIPELLEQAILAAEDSNFYDHGGIDLKGVLSAFYRNYMADRRRWGGSTITMQLARTLFLHRKKTWKRKIEEAFLAVELEKQFSKQQILTLYCNLINMAYGNYGMEAAARDYFGKPVGQLTLVEAATLAGIPQRPASHRVRDNPDLVVERRNYVLRRMREEGYIDQATLERTLAEPLLLATHRQEAEIGPYFAEEVRRYLSAQYGTTGLYDRGLQVATTLDRGIQRAGEAALREGLLQLDHDAGWRGAPQHLDDDDLEELHLPSWPEDDLVPGAWYEGIVLESGATTRVKIGDRLLTLDAEGVEWTGRDRPGALLRRGDVAWFRLAAGEDDDLHLVLEQEPEVEGAVVVLETASGAIRALVGGWDFNRNEFNRVTQARRQVGSAFKAFVFGAALESGFTAADTVFDGPVVFAGRENEPTYSPRNYYRRYYGILTLRRALERSINVGSVKLFDLVGVDRVIDFARRCGITEELPPYPSLALGSADISPLHLAAAYATFANRGVHVDPYLIETIRASDGRLLEEHRPRAHKAMEPQIAYLMTRMLEGVVRRGTGASELAAIELAMAGKTGTTNRYTDAWFVGYTPRYTLLTWVGYDRQRTLGKGMTGNAAALPIWRRIVNRGLEEGWLDPREVFPRPPGIVDVEVEAETGLLPGPEATAILREAFLAGTAPQRRYDAEWRRVMALPWFLQEPFYLPKEGERMPSDIEDWTLVQEAWEEKG